MEKRTITVDVSNMDYLVQAKARDIRNIINKPWLQNKLLQDRMVWHNICACMDVLEDTQKAIEDYTNLPDFSSHKGGYLYLYGLLQALFVQQDAIEQISNRLIGKKIDWKTNHHKIFNISELRNSAIGHPTNRKGNKSFHFISRRSICRSSFDIISYEIENDFKFEPKKCNVNTIIEDQCETMLILLDEVLRGLREQFNTHKMKFKKDKMIDKIPQGGYHISKLAEGISRADYTISNVNLSSLQEGMSNIKTAIKQRYGDTTALEWFDTVATDINYILDRFEQWINSDTLYQNKDAYIFWYALKAMFDELENMLNEIDEEFSDISE